MKRFAAVIFSSSLLMACAPKNENIVSHSALPKVPTPDEFRAVSPALEQFTQKTLIGEVWKRPQLTPRDRSLITVAALIANNQTVELQYHLSLALDNGVTPSEISEVIAHMAFYSGWGNATSAVVIAKEIFARRDIKSDQLSPASVRLLPVDEEKEAKRAETVNNNFGNVAPGVVHYTTDILFKNLWLRPGLAPRDRSLVTVSALIATGQVEQIPFHLNRAMDYGLTQSQAGEMLTQLAFYAGWPRVFSAMPVAKKVFESRKNS